MSVWAWMEQVAVRSRPHAALRVAEVGHRIPPALYVPLVRDTTAEVVARWNASPPHRSIALCSGEGDTLTMTAERPGAGLIVAVETVERVRWPVRVLGFVVRCALRLTRHRGGSRRAT